ncbi:hypothetical protein CN345_27560 [Bacillus thuringiensis]|uniref:hypothetical protein n=1 Tax=Bacillus thuringiensis TaxID=1428 RepID=UPI000BF81076|nr:hypothetical protein [Bacillus thuringiensis]PEZ25423.1 hypothetical protein CN345_27560 [Bacillus thuringiensis]PGY45721.1 hypothetical protein COE09_23940 [Bacillus thuringiensis]TEA80851.1 hypothetical protein PBMB05447_24435 [Bacillus thuringiensis F14-1]
MRVKKDMLKQWKADFQAIQEEKRRKNREKKKNKKYNIPGHTADFMDREDTYYKKNGVWKQKKK